MSDGDQLIKEGQSWAIIVPALVVSSLERSVDVYTRLFGFVLDHTEPERFAVVQLGGGQIVLNQYRPDDPMVVAELSLDPPRLQGESDGECSCDKRG